MVFRVVVLKQLSLILPIVIILALTFPMIILLLYYGRWDVALILLIPLLLLFSIFAYLLFARKVVIGENGIEYLERNKHYKMSWHDIKTIGIGYYPRKAPGRPPWIYFSVDSFANPKLSGKMSNEFIMAHYRKEIITEISKYWSCEIHGLHLLNEHHK
jgi:hypothetical protein